MFLDITKKKNIKIYPLKVSINRFTINEKGEEINNKVVNLLMISEECKDCIDECVEHVKECEGINEKKNISRLFSNQVNKNERFDSFEKLNVEK